MVVECREGLSRSLLAPFAHGLEGKAGVSCQSSVAETAAGLDTWSAGNEKAPAVVMTVGADARGLLDDLHVGADAFRGDVDVAGP